MMNKKLVLIYLSLIAAVFFCCGNIRADVDSDLSYLQSQLERNRNDTAKIKNEYGQKVKALKRSIAYKIEGLKRMYLENLKRLKDERIRLIQLKKDAQDFLAAREAKKMRSQMAR
ncbi:MAG: hypothetical protein V1674_06085 [Candidatus Omnitrophota bacterium]